MTIPLIAIAAVLLSAPGSAVPESAAPEHPSITALRVDLARVFLERPQERLIDIAERRGALLTIGAPLAQIESLIKAANEARVIQSGRAPGTSDAVFEQQIIQAAMGLGMTAPQTAVPVYLHRAADDHLTGEELAAHQALLEQVQRRQISPALTQAVRSRLITNARLLNTAQVTSWAGGGSPGRGAGSAGQPGGGARPPLSAADAAISPADVAARVAELNAERPASLVPLSLRTVTTNLPPPTDARPTHFSTTPMPWYVAQGSLDGARISDLLDMARRLPVRTFGGWCLRWVKRAVERSGFMEPAPRDPRREAARVQARNAFLGMRRAFMMARLTDTQLGELGLQPITTATIPWSANDPALNGLFLIWAPTCNREEIRPNARPGGTHPVAGHVEYIIPHDHPLAAAVPADRLAAKSDGTRGTSPVVLTRYSVTGESRTWVDPDAVANRRIVERGLGRISQPCLTVLAPLDLD